MINILHRYTKSVLFHSKTARTIAKAVTEAIRNGASLRNASLDDASLDGASLRNASLDGAEGYVNSHAIFAEMVRRQPIDTFTSAEWAAIGQIILHRLCWKMIRACHADVAPRVLAVLAEAGFPEWREHWIALEKEATDAT